MWTSEEVLATLLGTLGTRSPGVLQIESVLTKLASSWLTATFLPSGTVSNVSTTPVSMMPVSTTPVLDTSPRHPSTTPVYNACPRCLCQSRGSRRLGRTTFVGHQIRGTTWTCVALTSRVCHISGESDIELHQAEIISHFRLRSPQWRYSFIFISFLCLVFSFCNFFNYWVCCLFIHIYFCICRVKWFIWF